MKKGSTIFLKTVLVFIAAAVLFGMVRFPQTEGRAKDLNLIDIYNDPFIIYIYIASIPFFVGLFQAFKLLGFIDQNKIFSKNAVQALKTIRNCALISIGFIVGAATFILSTVKDPSDDPAGFIALCIITSVASLTVAAISSVFAVLLQKRVRK